MNDILYSDSDKNDNMFKISGAPKSHQNTREKTKIQLKQFRKLWEYVKKKMCFKVIGKLTYKMSKMRGTALKLSVRQ